MKCLVLFMLACFAVLVWMIVARVQNGYVIVPVLGLLAGSLVICARMGAWNHNDF